MKLSSSQIVMATGMALAAFGAGGLDLTALAIPAAIGATNQPALCSLAGPVGSVIVQPDGKIVISGGGNILFATAESDTLGHLNGTVARFHRDGSLDYSFGCRANPPNYVSVFATHLAIRSDGRLLMTGMFHTVDDQPRKGLAMLLSDGKLDEEFIPWRGTTNELLIDRPFSPLPIRPAAFDSDGQVIVPCLIRQNASGGPRVCRLDDSGRLLTNGQSVGDRMFFSEQYPSLLTERGLWLYRPVNWENAAPTEWSLNPPRTRFIWEFFTSGNPLSAGDAAAVLKVIFAEFPIELCRNAVRLPDGGAILLVQSGEAGRFMRFDKDWRPDLSYTNSLRARGYLSLALQKDGKLLVARGSDLWDVNGGNIIGVVRLNVDGSIDRSFRCETDERVMCLALQADGRILIGGFFRKVHGVSAPWFARLNLDGSLDTSFQTHFTNVAGLMAGRRMQVRSLTAAETVEIAKNTIVTKPNAVTNGPETSPHSVLITSLTLLDGTAVLLFMGNPNHAYILQARNALGSGGWFNVATNRTDAGGSGTLRDPAATNAPIRFYRVASP